MHSQIIQPDHNETRAEKMRGYALLSQGEVNVVLLWSFY
jgi:hypothetical protein